MFKFIDFGELKERVSIEDAMKLLDLNMKQSGKQYRGQCPTCEGSDRGLVITPDKGVYYCFSEAKGGDCIALAAHIKGCSAKEAAQFLSGPVPEERTQERPKSSEGFKPLEYLDPDHEAVEAVGFEPEDARALGIGYAPRGVLRGTVAVPMRNTDGSIAGYIGITEAKLPPKWHL
jgi:DNA primase